jgi:diguanylate cyclase (GGDEF)-like protein
MRVAIIGYGGKMLAVLALALTILLGAAPASASNIKLEACFRAAQPQDAAAEIIKKTGGFNCSGQQSSLTPGDYWISMDVDRTSHPKGDGIIFRTASLWDEGMELWAVHEGGQIEYYRPYADQGISPMRLGATIVVPLHSREAPVTMLLARVENSAAVRGVMLQSSLSSTESAITFEMTLAVLYAAFMGLCIALLVYNMAIWRGMREPFLLAYCAMLICSLVYGVTTSGAPHYFIDNISGADRLRFTIPLLAYTASSALIFTRFFFENANVPRWLVRLTYAQAALMSGFATLYAAIAPDHVKLLDAIYVDTFLPVPLLFGLFVWTAWRRKDPFLGYFLIAWTGPALSAVLRMMHGFDLIPYHILIENSTLLGLAFEALVSSLAIGYRVRLLAKARDRAEIAEAHAMAMADTDPLTGLLNRRSFMRKLLERQNHWTLILVDIDHFKRVNDSLGHAGGDDAITSIGGVLRKYTPEGAIVARMGGEEFAIAYPLDLPLTPDPDRLLADVRSIALPEGYRITASIGIASRAVADENDWKILYRAADMALYRAKSNGRDCFIRQQDERAAA